MCTGIHKTGLDSGLKTTFWESQSCLFIQIHLYLVFTQSRTVGAPRFRRVRTPNFSSGDQQSKTLNYQLPFNKSIKPLHQAKYTINTKACGHPFNLVDSAISTTPVSDRCIKSSTQLCNLNRQRLTVEWPYWKAQWLSTWHRHRMPPFQQVSLSKFCLARVAPVNCKWCYCEVETSRSNNRSALKW
jgi:hypothetical protein